MNKKESLNKTKTIEIDGDENSIRLLKKVNLKFFK